MRALKRLFDIAGAFILLVLFLPVILAVAIAIALTLGQPVLFRQARGGIHNSVFQFVKFRSMTSECGPDGRLLPDERRLTRFGHFLRSTSLDELPQLWNVLKGDMSLVGPRPLPALYLSRYDDRQRRRHDVHPGITGWAQIHGRNSLSWQRKFEYDIWYVDHRSFWLDLKILLKTVVNVIRREGISQEGHSTMPEFRGTLNA